MLRTEKIHGMRRPEDRHRYTLDQVISHDQSIDVSEFGWICKKNDLASISPNAEHNRLNGIVEDLLNWVSRRLVLVSDLLG